MNNTMDYTREVDHATLEQYTSPAGDTNVMGQTGTMEYANNMDHTSAMDSTSSPMHSNAQLNHSYSMGSFSPFAHTTAAEDTTAINHPAPMDFTSSPILNSIPMNNTSAMGYSSPFAHATAMNLASSMDHSSPLAHPTSTEYATPMNPTSPISYSSPAVHPATVEFPTYMDHRPQMDYSSAMGPNSPMVHQYALDYPRGMQNTQAMDFTHMNRVAPMGYTNTMGYAPAMNPTSGLSFPMDYACPMAYTTAVNHTTKAGLVAPMGHAGAMEYTTPMIDLAFPGPPGLIVNTGSMSNAGQMSFASPFNGDGQINAADRMSIAGPVGLAGRMGDAGAGAGAGLVSVADPMEDLDLMRDAGLVGAGPNNVAAEATTAARRPAPCPVRRPADEPDTRACVTCGRRRGAASFRDVKFLSALVVASVPRDLFPRDEWPGSVPSGGYLRCHPCRVKRALDAWGEYARAVTDRTKTIVRKEVKRVLLDKEKKEIKARVNAYIAAGLGQDDYLGDGGRNNYDPVTQVQITEEEREKRLNQGRCSFLGHLCNKKTEHSRFCPGHRALWLESQSLERTHQQAQQYWNETQTADAAADAAAGTGLPVELRALIPLPAAPQPILRQDPGTFVTNAIEAYHQPRLSHPEEKKAISKARQAQLEIDTKNAKAAQEAYRKSLKKPFVEPGRGLCSYNKRSCPVPPMPGKHMCELHREENTKAGRERTRERKEKRRREDAAAAAAKTEKEEGG